MADRTSTLSLLSRVSHRFGDRPDLLFLMLWVVMQVWTVGGGLAIVYVLTALIYIALDFIGLPMTMGDGSPRTRLGYTLRWGIIVLASVPTILLFTTVLISDRLKFGTDHVAKNVTAVDSMLQIELATQMILSGRNPYLETFEGTAIDHTPGVPGYEFNPAISHFVYPPLSFLLPVPFYVAAQKLLGWFDLRLILLPCFLVTTVFLLPALVENLARRLGLLVLMLFNPAVVLYVGQGQNEPFAFAWLVAVLFFLKKERSGIALLMLGLGCAMKQTLWFMFPFALVYLHKRQPPSQLTSWLMQNGLLVGMPMLLSLLPFVVWNLPALLDDMFGYVSGSGATGFPIMGYGFGQLILIIGLVKSPRESFPFWFFQAVIGIPALVILLRWLWHECKLSSLIIAYSIFMFVFFFFSRFFHDIYAVFVLMLLTAGFLIDESVAI